MTRRQDEYRKAERQANAVDGLRYLFIALLIIGGGLIYYLRNK
jgi:hypothetical protein